MPISARRSMFIGKSEDCWPENARRGLWKNTLVTMPDAPTGRVVWVTERRRDVSAGGERGRDYTAVVLGRWSAVEIQASLDRGNVTSHGI